MACCSRLERGSSSLSRCHSTQSRALVKGGWKVVCSQRSHRRSGQVFICGIGWVPAVEGCSNSGDTEGSPSHYENLPSMDSKSF